MYDSILPGPKASCVSSIIGRQIVALISIAQVSLGIGCLHREVVYPIGIYSVSNKRDLPEIRNAGFNLVVGPAEKDYFDAAASNELQVLAFPGTSAGKNFSASLARQTVNALGNHSALWAWYLVDEPDLHNIPPSQVKAANTFIKSLSPNKPTALVIYQGYSAIHYSGLSDILMIDRYPIPWLPLANFPQHVRMARLASGPKAPVIAIIQAFDWSYHANLLQQGEKNLRPPRYDEIRNMTYCALAQRASGLFYFGYNDGKWNMQEHPATWDAVKEVVAEVHANLPLFKGEHVWKPFVHRFENPEIRFNAALDSSITPAFLRVKKGTTHVPAGDYILAVNNTDERHVYSLWVGDLQSNVIPVLQENRVCLIRNQWLKDEFAPFAVHIYGPYNPGTP